MLILLPPSETKRDGGVEGSSLDLAALSFPSLSSPRKTALAGLRAISRSVASSTAALGLGPTQRHEIDRNRAVATSPTMPAIERYAGVLYDAIDVGSLDAAARRFLGDHVLIHSALFGLIRADDAIPAYRFSHDSRIPSTSLPALWRSANAAVLGELPGPVLDLRSESYVGLGPTGDGGHFLRVVTADAAGTRRARGHFNKHGKGELVRALALGARDVVDIQGLLTWAAARGIRLERSAGTDLVLVV